MRLLSLVLFMSITSHADNFTCNKMENMDNTFQAVLEINKIKKIEYSNESSVSGMLTITNLSKEWPLYTSECIKPKIKLTRTLPFI